MQKKCFAACFLLIVVTLAEGSQSTTEWVRYTSTEGRYSALVPQQPKLSSQDASASTGEKFTQFMAQATDSDSLYGFIYFDYPPDMDFSLDKARDGAVAAVKGTLLSEEAISLGGYPGRELKIAAKNSDLDLLIRARIYDVGRRVYVLQHIFHKSSDSPTVAEKTARFFDSFKVIQSK